MTSHLERPRPPAGPAQTPGSRPPDAELPPGSEPEPASSRRSGPPSIVRATLVSTTDLDEAAGTFRRVYTDARFDLAPGVPFACGMEAVAFGPVRRVRGQWSAPLQLETPGLVDRYVLTVNRHGLSHGTQGDEAFEIVPGRRGALFSPGRSVRMRAETAVQGRSLVLDRALVERHFRTLTGRDVPGSLTFEGALRFEDGAGAALLEVVSLFHRELDRPDASPLWLLGLRDAVLTSVLVHVRHSATSLLEAPAPRAAQACVRRVEEFIAAHATEPITMADIVAAAGVPERSLRAAFQAHGRASPMELLRRHRFEHAQRRLEAPSPATTVARVVAELGLGHPGRFSAEYKRRFGETPSETLERGLANAGLPRRHTR